MLVAATTVAATVGLAAPAAQAAPARPHNYALSGCIPTASTTFIHLPLFPNVSHWWACLDATMGRENPKTEESPLITISGRFAVFSTSFIARFVLSWKGGQRIDGLVDVGAKWLARNWYSTPTYTIDKQLPGGSQVCASIQRLNAPTTSPHTWTWTPLRTMCIAVPYVK